MEQPAAKLVRSPALLDNGAQLLELALRTKQRSELQTNQQQHINEASQIYTHSEIHTRFLVSFRAFLSCDLRARSASVAWIYSMFTHL